ncbi:LLM class flavin-dependent oxidoreductase [Paenarthrobacter nitroguajacolicus]|uniref:LLM class flavin-dependent oxidoreductase n=1 Tax=Paenarthrobacter nitroguajacolicus TaxID=211146 RepID=UPI001AE81A89|nr:LLM class flavin-dependent oxidoreductase [Paenarthrobacter nitroguajacolicus]MDR6639445.1 alkanesulfonate monooxygenase SsuD/methylene tetrahydromethanopterin reductase-like flavin-dependent oxidoreductase (luciferase family) [Paenarthrobacter nitroguajacolicus]
MDFGLFCTPYSPDYSEGRRTASEVIAWDLQLAEWADQYGLSEIFFAEHYTIGVEPSPAPDIMIAAASQRTKRIKLGAAAHLLPYHNPVNLACRLLWLHNMTNGRYIAGFAPGSFPTDAQLFDTGGNNAEMFSEALDIIDAVWNRKGPWRIDGKYWNAEMPEYTEQWRGPHLTPFDSTPPEVLLTGMQANSPTFIEAAQRGFTPMSQQVGVDVLNAHWETYSTASVEAGFTPSRRSWRILRDVFVAETDEEARRLVRDGQAGQTWRDHILPVFKTAKTSGGAVLGELFLDPGMTMDDLTLDWLVDHFWLVGSPDTVVAKVKELDEKVGGFGSVVSLAHEYLNDPEPYRRNLELLGTEVMPRLADVGARATSVV